MKEMNTWAPKQFVQYLDDQFAAAKKIKQSRMSVEWGIWSRQMNLVIRARIESRMDPDELKLKYVFVYWTLVSQLLELHFEGSFLRGGKIKRTRKEADEVRSIILIGKGLKEMDLDAEITKRILG